MAYSACSPLASLDFGSPGRACSQGGERDLLWGAERLDELLHRAGAVGVERHGHQLGHAVAILGPERRGGLSDGRLLLILLLLVGGILENLIRRIGPHTPDKMKILTLSSLMARHIT